VILPRIRTIKPEFPQSESMGRVSRDARLLFIQIWTLCDDSGKSRASSRALASLLYPFDNDVNTLIEGWLDELEKEGCIRRYRIDSTTYLDIPNWLKHQKIDHPSKSRIPDFREDSRIFASVSRTLATDLGPRTLEDTQEVLEDKTSCADFDLKARLFGDCTSWLSATNGGQPDKYRSQIGKWIRDHGTEKTFAAFFDSQKENPQGDRVAYITRVLTPRPKRVPQI
jgi:hypothetical protein